MSISGEVSTDRPLPHPTELSAPHWEGAKQGRLMVQRCRACGAYVFIPRAACTQCFADALEWVESSGRGSVYSFTIIHRPPHPAFEPPYCAAIIALDEGWHMISNIVDTPFEAIQVGMPVEARFVVAGDAVLPMFAATNV